MKPPIGELRWKRTGRSSAWPLEVRRNERRGNLLTLFEHLNGKGIFLKVL
jgi:hypothetical protein